MRSVQRRVAAIKEGVGQSPWPGWEYARGWGVFALPFDSGHVLALRVFPQNSFAPYRTVWHRTPEGSWSILADAPSLDIACPRYYGPACDTTALARIDVIWTGPRSFEVTMDRPALRWTVDVHSTPLLGAVNALAAAMPAVTWKSAALIRLREWMARGLGLGRIELTGVMPSGHQETLMPRLMYYIDDSRATLDGLDLGRPARPAVNPDIGGVPLPARGIMAMGQAVWRAAVER